MVINWFLICALRYGDATLGGAELEELKSLRILEATLDSKLTFETHLREVASKAARSQGVMSRAEKLLDCSRVLKSCFNAYVLFSLKYCAPYGCRLRSFIWV